jgi:hypothetical protein
MKTARRIVRSDGQSKRTAVRFNDTGASDGADRSLLARLRCVVARPIPAAQVA